VRSKIEIDRSILEQVREFNYLGYDGESELKKQISKNMRHC